MGSTWLKIKLWTKVVVLGAAALIILVVLLKNWDTRVTLDFWFHKYDERLLLVLLLTCVFSIFGWWVFKTIFRTLRQFREANDRLRLERLEREQAEMKAKAAKLQTRPEATAEGGPGSTTSI
jgi:uncharacterized integral membrane protein